MQTSPPRNIDSVATWAFPAEEVLANWRLWLTLATVVLLQVGVVYWPPLQRLFGSVALGLADWAICLGIASTVFVAEEIRKVAVRGLRAVASAYARLGVSRVAPRAR